MEKRREKQNECTFLQPQTFQDFSFSLLCFQLSLSKTIIDKKKKLSKKEAKQKGEEECLLKYSRMAQDDSVSWDDMSAYNVIY